jgi:succinate dehydrogenase (ubiquinone) membrane anchor subunit
MSGLALVGLTPVAIALSPSAINLPVDLSLGVIFPYHAHVALNYVISDYVPKASRSIARAGLLGVTVVTALGLLKLNLTDVGLTETLKSLWKRKEGGK